MGNISSRSTHIPHQAYTSLPIVKGICSVRKRKGVCLGRNAQPSAAHTSLQFCQFTYLKSVPLCGDEDSIRLLDPLNRLDEILRLGVADLAAYNDFYRPHLPAVVFAVPDVIHPHGGAG